VSDLLTAGFSRSTLMVRHSSRFYVDHRTPEERLKNHSPQFVMARIRAIIYSIGQMRPETIRLVYDFRNIAAHLSLSDKILTTFRFYLDDADANCFVRLGRKQNGSFNEHFRVDFGFCMTHSTAEQYVNGQPFIISKLFTCFEYFLVTSPAKIAALVENAIPSIHEAYALLEPAKFDVDEITHWMNNAA
jgi:hypothetical protein